jgi:hypothetical protein
VSKCDVFPSYDSHFAYLICELYDVADVVASYSGRQRVRELDNVKDHSVPPHRSLSKYLNSNHALTGRWNSQRAITAVLQEDRTIVRVCSAEDKALYFVYSTRFVCYSQDIFCH